MEHISDKNMPERMAERVKHLTPIQHFVTQEKGTERPFTGEYWNFFSRGTYRCVCCQVPLFDSETKFRSTCGWPSFFDTKFVDHLALKPDNRYGMERTEVLCQNCGAHLGHLFADGPLPTRKRYCINSASLQFDEKINHNNQ